MNRLNTFFTSITGLYSIYLSITFIVDCFNVKRKIISHHVHCHEMFQSNAMSSFPNNLKNESFRYFETVVLSIHNICFG